MLPLTRRPAHFYLMLTSAHRTVTAACLVSSAESKPRSSGKKCGTVVHTVAATDLRRTLDEMELSLEMCCEMCSPCSINSNWVKTEIANARSREEQQRRQMLFPITLVPFDRDQGMEAVRHGPGDR